jgi:iron complex transport system permease protein
MTESGRRAAVFASLGSALPIAILVAVSLGSVSLPLMPLLGSFLEAAGFGGVGGGLDGAGEAILWSVRMPRVLLAALVGGGLAVVGAALQSVFRNPMADPGLLGVGAGAALGAVVSVKLGWAASLFLALPAAAFAGALAAALAAYVLAHAFGRPTLHGLLLTGLAVGALAGAGTSVTLVAMEEYRVKTVLFWLAGGLEGRSWDHVRIGACLILPGFAALTALSRPLDLLSCGEDEAAALGLRVHWARLSILTLASVVAGAATAAAGSVPFVGLIAPHAVRPLVGSQARHQLPAAFLAGALLVVAADTVARTVSDRFDLPLGALTALVGAPYFLVALRANEGRS